MVITVYIKTINNFLVFSKTRIAQSVALALTVVCVPFRRGYKRLTQAMKMLGNLRKDIHNNVHLDRNTTRWFTITL